MCGIWTTVVLAVITLMHVLVHVQHQLVYYNLFTGPFFISL